MVRPGVATCWIDSIKVIRIINLKMLCGLSCLKHSATNFSRCHLVSPVTGVTVIHPEKRTVCNDQDRQVFHSRLLDSAGIIRSWFWVWHLFCQDVDSRELPSGPLQFLLDFLPENVQQIVSPAWQAFCGFFSSYSRRECSLISWCIF